MTPVELERRRVQVSGVVQGVGFRPFVYTLATRNRLVGFVRNDGATVVAEVEGHREALERFATALVRDAPPTARVADVSITALAASGGHGFAILPSTAAGADTAVLIGADIAICQDCLRELRDPRNRRYRHPFITCAQCGPRFTIARSAPYDRATTTMAGFAMCEQCRREYDDPSDRRFHAETISCSACGPRLSMPLDDAIAVLQGGGILAVKGIGGYHLACDATSEAAVERLRARKERERKPLAVMTLDPDSVAICTPAEQELLASAAAPIVLLDARPGAPIARSVTSAGPSLGLMTPYTPLHHLLLDGAERPLVMTSGNRREEPIAIDDDDARRRLGSIADAFLGHDRPIHRRCEDSVVRAGFPIRRSRGYAPSWLTLPHPARRPLVAVGASMKATFCVAHDERAWLSPHLGDLDTEPAARAFAADLALHLAMLAVEPELIACDLHPDYASTRWAHEQDAEIVTVQHHHAHAAACLAEHGLGGPALALVFDGTGYGPDGTLWGGELLRCDLTGFERLAHLEPVQLPGGESAIREPWRVAASYLERAGRPVPFERWGEVRQSLRVNAPRSSGMGRLFDAVAALLGVCERVSYEGQAAVELDWLAGTTHAEPYACSVEDGVIAGADLVRAAFDDLDAGRPRAEIAAAFHEGVAAVAVRVCELAEQPRLVVLSGGSFQNLRLRASVASQLRGRGFRVLTHRKVPANDGAISFGQAAVAAARDAA